MTLLSDAATMISNGQTAATKTASIAAAGPIQDVLGALEIYKLKLQELKTFLTNLKASCDSGDGNVTTIDSHLSTIG